MKKWMAVTGCILLLSGCAADPEQEKSDIQIKALFGWSKIDSIQPYMNHNSEIMANAAYKRHSKKDGGGND